MNRLRTARILVAIPALMLSIIPPIADFNPSHVTNPLWPAHARLHTVWLVCSNSMISLLALAMLWRHRGDSHAGSIRLAATLLGAVLLGFFVAAASQSAYGGALTDPNGIPFRIGPLDANLAAFSLYAGMVLTGAALTRTSPT